MCRARMPRLRWNRSSCRAKDVSSFPMPQIKQPYSHRRAFGKLRRWVCGGRFSCNSWRGVLQLAKLTSIKMLHGIELGLAQRVLLHQETCYAKKISIHHDL